MKQHYTTTGAATLSGLHDDLIRKVWIFVFVMVYAILVPTGAYAAKSLSGTVRDSATGDTLPVAHIRIEGMRSGTITNAEGKYSLELDILPATLSVSYIGYHTKKISVTEDTPEALDIALEANPVLLPEVIVTPGNSAERIMRRVIEHKKEWRSKLETFRADAYSRVNLSGNKKIAMISESISELYWDHEQGIKEIVKSKRHTKNIEQKETVAHAQWIPNLYDDDIEMFGFNMAGVTHPDALKYYKFELVDQKLMDDRTVHIITVEPKSKLQPLFRGRISVLDGEFAVLDFDLVPNEAVMFPPPLSEFRFTAKQQFSSFGEDVWLPVDVRIDGTIKIKLSFLLEFPVMNYSQVTRLSDYDVNVALPDSLFKKKDLLTSVTISNEKVSVSTEEIDNNGDTQHDPDENVSADKSGESDDSGTKAADAGDTAADDAVERAIVESQIKPDELHTAAAPADSARIAAADSLAKLAEKARADSLFAVNRHAIPFTLEEETAYASIDSSDTVDEAFKPTGVLAKLIPDEEKKKERKRKIQEKEKHTPSKISRAVSNATDGFAPYFRHNRVEGYLPGLNYKRTFKKRYEVRGRAAWSSALETPTWWLRNEVFFKKDNKLSVYAEVADENTIFGATDNYPVFITSIATLSGGKDYFDYYNARRARTGVRYRAKKNVIYDLAVRAERHGTLVATPFDDLTGSAGNFRINPAADEGDLYSAKFFFRKGDEHNPFGIVAVKGVSVSVEQGWHGGSGSYAGFTKLTTGADWQFKTFLRRRLFPMTLDFSICGSASAGDLPVQRFASIDTRFMAWTPFGAFKSLGGRPLQGEHSAAIFLDHNFRTVPFELIGLRWLAKKNVGIVAHCAAGRTWISDAKMNELSYLPNYADHIVSEGGFALNGVFGLGRIDFTKRFDSGEYSVGFNMARLL